MRAFSPRNVIPNDMLKTRRDTAPCCPTVAVDVSAVSSLQVGAGTPWGYSQEIATKVNTTFSSVISEDHWGNR